MRSDLYLCLLSSSISISIALFCLCLYLLPVTQVSDLFANEVAAIKKNGGDIWE